VNEKDINHRIQQLKERNLELINEMSSINEQFVGYNHENSNNNDLKNKRLEIVSSPKLNSSSIFTSKKTSSIERKDLKLIQPDKLIKQKQFPTLNYPKTNEKLTSDLGKQNVQIPSLKSKQISSSLINKNSNKSNSSSTNIPPKVNVNSNQPNSIWDNLITLADKVNKFIREMINLQDAISKKVSNVKELKQNFETNKADLLYYANECLRMKKESFSISDFCSPIKNVVKEEVLNVVEIPGFCSPEKEEIINREIPQSCGGAERTPDLGESKDIFKEPETSPIPIRKPAPKEKNNETVKIESLEKELNKIKENYALEKENSQKEINTLNDKLTNLITERNRLKEIEENLIRSNEISKIILIIEILNLEKDNSTLSSDNLCMKNTISDLNKEIQYLNTEIHEMKQKITELEELVEFSNNEKLIYIQKNEKNDEINHYKLKEIEGKLNLQINILEERLTEKDKEIINEKHENELKQSYIIKIENENISLKSSINTLKESLLNELNNVELVNKKKDYTLSLLNKTEIQNQELENEVKKLKETLILNEKRLSDLETESQEKRELNFGNNLDYFTSQLKSEISFFEILLNRSPNKDEIQEKYLDTLKENNSQTILQQTFRDCEIQEQIKRNSELEEKTTNLNELVIDLQSKEKELNVKIINLTDELNKESLKSQDLIQKLNEIEENSLKVKQEMSELNRYNDSIMIQIRSLLSVKDYIIDSNNLLENLSINLDLPIVKEIHEKLKHLEGKTKTFIKENDLIKNEFSNQKEIMKEDNEKKLISIQNENKKLKELKEEFEMKITALLNEKLIYEAEYEEKLKAKTKQIMEKEEVIINLECQINKQKLDYLNREKTFETKISELISDINESKEKINNLEKEFSIQVKLTND